MKQLDRIGATLTVVAGLSGVGSQMPELLSCTYEDGRSATEWTGSDIAMPYCDADNMSDTANMLHDTGKLIAIVSGAGAAACAVILGVEERRRGAGYPNGSL